MIGRGWQTTFGPGRPRAPDLAMFFTMVTTHNPSLSQFDLSAMRQFSSFLMCTCMCTLQTAGISGWEWTSAWARNCCEWCRWSLALAATINTIQGCQNLKNTESWIWSVYWPFVGIPTPVAALPSWFQKGIKHVANRWNKLVLFQDSIVPFTFWITKRYHIKVEKKKMKSLN